MLTALSQVDLDTAIGRFRATYDQLVFAGIDPHIVVIAMSEIVAYCLAQKAVTGGGEAETLAVWRVPFESSYREYVIEAKTAKAEGR